MEIKYRMDFRNHHNQLCRVDILNEDYEGDMILVRGVGENACTIAYDCSDDPFEPIVNSKANISMYNQGQIDIAELQLSGDRDFTVRVYVDNMTVPYWTGFIIPDGIQNPYKAAPYQLNITAVDGLMLLSDIDFTFIKPAGAADPTISNLIDTIFGSTHLGLPLPVLYDIDMDSLNKDDNTVAYHERRIVEELYMAPLNSNNANSEGDKPRSCKWLLEGLIKAASARIYQKDGNWIIEQVLRNDIKATKAVGRAGYALKNDDAYIMMSGGLKGVDVQYNYTKDSNVITNGSFDKVNPLSNMPENWYPQSGMDPNTHSAYFGYNNRDDNGVQVKGDTLISEKNNINSFVNFKGIQITFDFMAVSGFPMDENGYLNNNSEPIVSIGVGYVCKGGKYWNASINDWAYLEERWYELTEFGYFKRGDTGDYGTVKFTLPDLLSGNRKLKHHDVIQVSFDKFGDIKLPNPGDIDKHPDGTWEPNESYLVVSIFESSLGDTVSMYGNLQVTVNDEPDIYQVRNNGVSYTEIEEIDLDIAASFNSFFDSDIKDSYKDTNKTYVFDVYGKKLSISESVGYQTLRLRQKPSTMFSGSLHVPAGTTWKYGEMYTIDSMADKRFLPMRMQYNIESCTISANLFEFRDEEVEGLEITHVGGSLKEGEPIESWQNDLRQSLFFSQWIEDNCPGADSGVWYIVPQGTYTSYISQLDANGMADVDVQQNGQAYANNIRMCPSSLMMESENS